MCYSYSTLLLYSFKFKSYLLEKSLLFVNAEFDNMDMKIILSMI